MPIKRRTFPAPPKKQPKVIIRRRPDPETRAFADTIEEYVYSIPTSPIEYSRLVVDWILPYQSNYFKMFGRVLRLTPRYKAGDANLVTVNGLLVEIVVGGKNPKFIVSGPRGVWHGKIKFFVKTHSEE